SRWLMQANERVGIIPVTARHVVPIDNDDVCVGLGQQLVCEDHADSAAADNQIVSRQHLRLRHLTGPAGAKYYFLSAEAPHPGPPAELSPRSRASQSTAVNIVD